MIGWEDILQYGSVFFLLIIAAFGAPIPEELAVITGGVMTGNAFHNPDSGIYWWVMLPLCIVGVVLCDVILYFIGRCWGNKLLEFRWVQRHVITPEKRIRIEANFHEYGIMILLFARLLPGIRTPIFIMAGVMRLSFRRFLIADGIYAIPGVNLFFWLAYWYTDAVMDLYNKIESNRPIVVLVILTAILLYMIYYFFTRPVQTGDPKAIPVIGEPLARIGHQLHQSHADVPTAPPPPAPSTPEPPVPAPSPPSPQPTPAAPESP
jgi:membrane protein DedA with SNARE-associated domain